VDWDPFQRRWRCLIRTCDWIEEHESDPGSYSYITGACQGDKSKESETVMVVGCTTNEVVAIMRTDLEEAGIDPDKYLGPNSITANVTIPLSFVSSLHIGPYGDLLNDWLRKCPYYFDLVKRLFKFATAIGQGYSTIGNVIESQVLHQSVTKRITPDEFYKWLLQASSVENFMIRLLTW